MMPSQLLLVGTPPSRGNGHQVCCVCFAGFLSGETSDVRQRTQSNWILGVERRESHTRLILRCSTRSPHRQTASAWQRKSNMLCLFASFCRARLPRSPIKPLDSVSHRGTPRKPHSMSFVTRVCCRLLHAVCSCMLFVFMHICTCICI